MGETHGTRPPEPPGTAAEPRPAAEYQPPAIAWDEPLEAIAATSCGFLPGGECDFGQGGGAV